MELDKFIKMIPGSIRKKVHVDLSKLGKAFTKEDTFKNSNSDKGLEAIEGTPSIVMGTDPSQGPSGGEGDTGGGGAGGGGV
jgi:hypothetical protein